MDINYKSWIGVDPEKKPCSQEKEAVSFDKFVDSIIERIAIDFQIPKKLLTIQNKKKE